MAKLVARLLVTASSLGSNPDIPQKSQMGDSNQKSCQHTLAHQKIYIRILERRIYRRKQDSVLKNYLYIYL
jgi:hypothetical protein